MTHAAQSILTLTARVLMSAIFLFSAVSKVLDFGGTTKYMASEGMLLPAFFLIGAIGLELFGAGSLLAGWWTRAGALALIAFLIPATLIFHDFWHFEGPAVRTQQVNFLKNVAIGGGLLMLLAYGPGGISLDHRRAPRV